MDRQDEIRRQLMATFETELEERVTTLNQDLLALEKGLGEEAPQALVAELFRAAHSLKGAARAVNVPDIELLSHRLEDVLGAMQQGRLRPSAAVFDAAFPAVDALREAMAAHLAGGSLPQGQRDGLLAGLQMLFEEGMQEVGEAPLATALGSPTPGHRSEAHRSEPASRPAPAAPSTTAPGSRTAGSEDTVRVRTAKLDALMAGAGELLVARMRSEQRLLELQTLQRRVNRWEKDWRKVRSCHMRLQRQGKPAPDMAPLLGFLERNELELKALGTWTHALLDRCGSDYGHLSLLTDDLEDCIRRMRMLPISRLFDQAPRMVRDLAHAQGKDVTVQIEGSDTEVDRQVLECMKDPLMHMLRNAVDHGIEPPETRTAAGKTRQGIVRLSAEQKGHSLILQVADDGRGIDLQAVRRAAVERKMLDERAAAALSDRQVLDLVFRPGLSTCATVTDLSGRGVGLDVVRQNLERLHGVVQVESAADRGATFTLTLPLTLATSHVLLLQVAGQTVAVPTTTVQRVLRVEASSVGSVDGRPAISVDGSTLPLVSLAQVLGLRSGEPALTPGQKMSVVVLGVAERRTGCRVDGFEGTQEVVIKSLGGQLKRVRNVAGCTILGSGQVAVVLSVADLTQAPLAVAGAGAPQAVELRQVQRRRVLVVDDSITTRTLEKNLLSSAGYEVLVAADGQEAWAMVQSEALDIIISDLAMPRMDGFTLTEKVKKHERLKGLPVVLVTSLESPQDKIRGLEAGADAYIVKSAFDQQGLLATIERLTG